MSQYARIFATFVRNSVVREMTFRGNFLIQVITRAFWFFARVMLFEIIYSEVDTINDWSRPQYFAFIATHMLISSLVEIFFMPNCANFSEQIRTGKLDFVLVKPIDSQFLVSLERVNLAMFSQVLLALVLLARSMIELGQPVPLTAVALYVLYIVFATAFFYSLMLTLAATSIWFGRNQGLLDFWFYVTVFAQYPRSIYNGEDDSQLEAGEVIQFVFSFLIPILLAVTVPARLITGTLSDWRFAGVAAVAAAAGLVVSRGIFKWSLNNYRSASS